jgi:hypothetical protein
MLTFTKRILKLIIIMRKRTFCDVLKNIQDLIGKCVSFSQISHKVKLAQVQKFVSMLLWILTMNPSHHIDLIEHSWDMLKIDKYLQSVFLHRHVYASKAVDG